jgi:hypothetical protein
MCRLFNLRNLAAAAVIGVASGAGGAGGSASACERPVYKVVTVWVDREEPWLDTVVRYDHCYRPYPVDVVRYRTVSVPVRKVVKVSW